jgi:hypothetical protein
MTPRTIIVRVVHIVEYYDYVLGLVPLALVGITAVLHVIGVATLVAIPVGSVVASLVVGHALFINGPTDRPAGRPDDTPTHSAGRTPVNAD